MLGAAYSAHGGERLVYECMVIVEESLEMIGMPTFLDVLIVECIRNAGRGERSRA